MKTSLLNTIILIWFLCKIWSGSTEISSEIKTERSLLSLCNFAPSWEYWPNSTCTFLNNNCVDDTSTDISSESYDQSTEYVFWNHAISSGYIDISSDYGTPYLMSFDNSASVGQIWEWMYTTNSDQYVRITMSRNTRYYEDINISFYFPNKLPITYTNNDLKDCSSTILSFDKAGSEIAVVRIKKYSASSNFSAKITQNKQTSLYLIGLIIVITLIALIICTTMFLWWMIIVHWKRQMRLRRERFGNSERVRYLREYTETHSTETLAKMRHGSYEEFNAKYHQDSCVIWLEDYKNDSQVHITNEWEHIFHSKWLKEWYQAIPATKPLSCPHWNTVNTPDSTPPDNKLQELSMEGKIQEETKYLDSRVMLTNTSNLERMTREIMEYNGSQNNSLQMPRAVQY